mmetsp:Transcript_50766/g.121326  ORF Transcript_50766/g.121326 Transcript_50766/m.121326 type:complete len:204 (-) Transcript_50766:460-1071(-)
MKRTISVSWSAGMRLRIRNSRATSCRLSASFHSICIVRPSSTSTGKTKCISVGAEGEWTSSFTSKASTAAASISGSELTAGMLMWETCCTCSFCSFSSWCIFSESSGRTGGGITSSSFLTRSHFLPWPAPLEHEWQQWLRCQVTLYGQPAPGHGPRSFWPCSFLDSLRFCFQMVRAMPQSDCRSTRWKSWLAKSPPCTSGLFL